ncbi:MAG: NADH-quinone oxidoreductase subunit NuoN [Sphingomonadaceae bacterium]
MDFVSSLALIAPELVLGVSGLVLLLVAAWGGDRASRAVNYLTIIAIIAAAGLTASVLFSGTRAEAFAGQMQVDAFSAFAKLLVYASAIGSLLVAPPFFERMRAMRVEYPVLVLFAVLGMGIMVSSGNMLTLYIGLEMTSLASYVLAAFLPDSRRSAEAGLKYFVLGSLASGFLLYGMSLTYGFTGTTSFAGISAATAAGLSNGALFGLIFMLAGLAFKISAVPFHMWTPDVYEGAPTPVTMFFASAPKVAAMALTMRVVFEAFGTQVWAWQQIVIFASLASIVVGALGAIGQDNIKRLLAYSSINNVGFILIGLAAATPQGASGMLVYLVIYVAMTLGSFAAVQMLRDADGNPVESIAQMAGMSTYRKVLSACLAMIMFSLAGIPPLFGFWGKFVVFQAAVDAGLVPLAFIGIAASVIGAFYYLKVVKVMYFDTPVDGITGQSGWEPKLVLGVSALVVSPLGYLLTGCLGYWADMAASVLFPIA